MVEHRRKQILRVGRYVEFATGMTGVKDSDAEVCFVNVLNFVHFAGVRLGLLVGFRWYHGCERGRVVIVDRHGHVLFGRHFYVNSRKISYHKRRDVKVEYFLKLYHMIGTDSLTLDYHLTGSTTKIIESVLNGLGCSHNFSPMTGYKVLIHFLSLCFVSQPPLC